MNLKPDDFKEIGIAIHRVDPVAASRILNRIRLVKPEENDVKKIPVFFNRFCRYKDIDGINSKTHTKTEYVYLRYVFIAAMIKLYNPELLSEYHLPRIRRDIKLRSVLSKLLNVHPPWISQSIATVCMHLKVYPDFEIDVNSTIEVIKK